jgi:hypothetical protein
MVVGTEILFVMASAKPPIEENDAPQTPFAESSRIVFPDNPWPNGHAVEEFEFDFALTEGALYLHLHLKSAKYYAEDPSYFDEDAEEEEAESSWTSKPVWGNYHNCTISSSKWGMSGLQIATPGSPFLFALLANTSFTSDPEPVDLDDDRNFGLYLLGHDTAAAHEISVTGNVAMGAFDIDWQGKIALTYAGDEDFDYLFHARIAAVRFGGIRAGDLTEVAATELLATLVTDAGLFVWKSEGEFSGFVLK